MGGAPTAHKPNIDRKKVNYRDEEKREMTWEWEERRRHETRTEGKMSKENERWYVMRRNEMIKTEKRWEETEMR